MELYILLIVFVFIIIIVNCNNTEYFETTSTSDPDNVVLKSLTINTLKSYIYNIYQADVKAIQNLSNLAQQLQNSGVLFPGDINVKGQIKLYNVNGASSNLLSFNCFDNPI